MSAYQASSVACGVWMESVVLAGVEKLKTGDALVRMLQVC